MDASWVSLMPPLMVIVIVFMTQKLNVSLLFGVVVSSLIAVNGNIILALKLCVDRSIIHFSDTDNIYLYVLLVMISSLIVLLTVTGSAAGCARIIGKKMKTKRSVEASSILLSVLLSIDDYLTILTVGFVMRPIADRLAVARTKLAYIVHALAGPLVIIMPISTWAAAILAQLDNAGINHGPSSKIAADSFYVYLHTIPFIFYSLIVVASVCFVVWAKISFGPLSLDEEKAMAITVLSDDDGAELNDTIDHSLIELFMPIMLLIGGVFFGILYAGDFWGFGGSSSFVDAFRQNDKTFLILSVSAFGAFFASLLLSLYKKMVTISHLPGVIYEGFELIKSSIIMVVLASLLGTFLRLDLHTGSYVAYLLLGKAPLYLLPVLLFIVSLIVTIATGSAWGTFSLLIPITTEMLIAFLRLEPPIALDQITILFPVLGALLSGAACGNHISPFAETTIMTATSTGTEPLHHAYTQFSYAVPVVIGTLVSFIIVGLLSDKNIYVTYFVSLLTGIVLCCILLMIGNKFCKKRF